MGNSRVKPGRPVRLELNAQRVTIAVEFYQTLFGWRSVPLHVAPWGSIPQIVNGERVFANEFMAMGAFSPPRWLIWFSGDLEQAESTIKDNGGSVGDGIVQLGDLGHLLGAQDPAGNEFAMIRLKHPPPEKDAPGDPCLAEMWGNNIAKLAPFYADVIGLEFTETAVGAALSYDCDPRIFFRDTDFDLPNPHWVPYFLSTSVGGDCERARRAGAIVQVPKDIIEGMGELVVLSDPGGAYFGLVDPTKSPDFE